MCFKINVGRLEVEPLLGKVVKPKLEKLKARLIPPAQSEVSVDVEIASALTRGNPTTIETTCATRWLMSKK